MVIDLSIEVKTDISETGARAKHLVIDINSKKADFPKRAAHLSKSDSSDANLFKKEFKDSMVTEFAFKITPKTLRELINNPTKHQHDKDIIRNMLSDVGEKSINIAYPILINERNPNEPEHDYQPHGQPSDKILIKLFDLFDVDGFDILTLPITSNGNSLEWAKMATSVFKSRKADYLNEYMLSGFIPRSVKESTAINMAKYYIENDIESLTFDFATRKISEARMRGIIDGIGDKWGKLHVHGTNIPHYNWHGTWKKPALPIYDVLVSIYGFDSFGNLRLGMGGEPTPPHKIKEKMERQRYRLIDTYGTYNLEGITKISENHTIECKCPTCRKTKILDLYNRPSTNDDFMELKAELKTHRVYSTFKEMNQINKLIEKDKYIDHIKDKTETTNDVASILKSFEK